MKLIPMQGPSKNCPCLLVTTELPFQQGSWAFLTAQQEFLNSVLAETTAICTLSSVTMTLSGWSGPPVMTNCMCGPTMVGTQMAVSGTVTTTYCQTGSSAPPGYTNIGGSSTKHPSTVPTATTTAPIYRTSTMCNVIPDMLSPWPQPVTTSPCQTFTYVGPYGYNTV